MAPPNLEALPPEMIMRIVDHVSISDYLCLQLSCKTFKACMPKTLQEVILAQHGQRKPETMKATKTNLNRGLSYGSYASKSAPPIMEDRHTFELARVEYLLGKSKAKGRKWEPPQILLCTVCKKHKERSIFVDQELQAFFRDDPPPTQFFLRERRARSCIPCCEASNGAHYSNRASVKVGGQVKFICVKCATAKSLDEGVHLRDQGRKYCVNCADAGGVKYTKASASCGYAFVVYDPLIDIDQIVLNRRDGKI